MPTTLVLLSFLATAADAAELPDVLDDRLQIQLVADSPDVRTPTGIAVDERGRVLVIESHTHFPPPNYDGPKSDRILLLEDFDPATGKARKISTFFEGTTHTMNLAIYHDGSIYVATRMEIFRLRDTDDDGKADERTPICHLDTPGNYPHNGLSGLAFDFAGNVYFGFGENLGAEYKLIGSDGKELKGGGEGGNVYCCDSGGKNVRRVATGFWNPFGLGFDAFGRLFCVDNDPDSRPPCRLLHVVEGGDYGFRFRNGRKGVHPFTAWNGELPGTLPMVAGTGEAPCAVMAYESDNLPEEYRGDLMVTSWGDHRLERYKLRPRGASFGAEMTPVIRGGENFRPVGLALAPDGSLYMSDWVDKSYNLHGKGRVWRISAKQPAELSRPKESALAISSSHGPLREAAARTLSRDEALSIAGTDPSQRTRVLASRAALAKIEGYDEFLEQTAEFDGLPQEAVQWRLDRMIAAFALHEPAELFNASLALEYTAKMWTGNLDDDEFEKAEAFLEKFEIKRFIDQKYPLELRLAVLPQLLSDYEVELPELPDVAADPWIQNEFTLVAQNEVRDAAPRPNLFGFLFGLADSGPSLKSIYRDSLIELLKSSPAEARIQAIALRREAPAGLASLIPNLLESSDNDTRLLGVLWCGEGAAEAERQSLERLLAEPGNSRQIFEATLAALTLLGAKGQPDPRAEAAGEEYIVRLLLNKSASGEARRFALRTLRSDHPVFTAQFLSDLLASPDATLRLEAIRTLRQRPDTERWPQLREIAGDPKAAAQLRCEAILGLSPGNQNDRKLLFALTKDGQPEVADEALRALRGFDLTPEEKEQLTLLAATLEGPRKELAERVLARNPPKNLPKHEDVAAWLKLAEGDGNPQAGERIYYHLRVGGCFRCHEFEGRGYTVGPDLSTISRSMTRERLVQSLVDPSREIAPQFTNWSILKTDGEVLTGIHVGDEVDGRMRFADQNGRAFHVHPDEIDQRKPSSQSIMPLGLVDNLTPQELRDLVSFLLRN